VLSKQAEGVINFEATQVDNSSLKCDRSLINARVTQSDQKSTQFTVSSGAQTRTLKWKFSFKIADSLTSNHLQFQSESISNSLTD
jgi:hypothetical protein